MKVVNNPALRSVFAIVLGLMRSNVQAPQRMHSG